MTSQQITCHAHCSRYFQVEVDHPLKTKKSGMDYFYHSQATPL